MDAPPLPGVRIVPLKKYADSRGWLTELFRDDELPDGFRPAMGYLSVTLPGVARGPHEHVHQTDCFAFLSGTFELILWENRAGRPAERHSLYVGENNPAVIFVPPGVVHAYRNVGDSDAFVLNFPDRLYAGPGKSEPVDEIRHEGDPDSPFQMP
ncbi:MAG TPA: WxcM-like domain-containing protein [Fimbriimonadaceae bacterium]|nr:WxcM-like domain-containing protein [Fimbriimonadaceae bacterium]